MKGELFVVVGNKYTIVIDVVLVGNKDMIVIEVSYHALLNRKAEK